MQVVLLLFTSTFAFWLQTVLPRRTKDRTNQGKLRANSQAVGSSGWIVRGELHRCGQGGTTLALRVTQEGKEGWILLVCFAWIGFSGFSGEGGGVESRMGASPDVGGRRIADEWDWIGVEWCSCDGLVRAGILGKNGRLLSAWRGAFARLQCSPRPLSTSTALSVPSNFCWSRLLLAACFLGFVSQHPWLL